MGSSNNSDGGGKNVPVPVPVTNTSTSTSPSFPTALIAGGLAGTSVDVALFPIDTLKTRMQSPQGFIKAGGFRGIYNGLGAAAIGSAPGAALFFSSYEVSLFKILAKLRREQQKIINCKFRPWRIIRILDLNILHISPILILFSTNYCCVKIISLRSPTMLSTC